MVGFAIYVGIVGFLVVMGACGASRAWLRQPAMRSTLAAAAVVMAVILVLRGLALASPRFWPAVLPAAAGIVVGPLIGRALRIQECINLPVQWGAKMLHRFPALASRDAFLLCLVLLALNPAGWLAGWLHGVSDDPLCLAWKAAMDGITLVGLSSWRPGPFAVAAIVSGVVQSIAGIAGMEARRWMESRGLVAPCMIAVGIFWLTLPLLLLGIRKVPLARLMLAVPAAVLLAAWLS